MSSSSGFKYLFWALVVFVVALLTPLAVFIGFGFMRTANHLPHPVPLAHPVIAMAPLLVLVAAYIALVAVLTYRDASKRGMDPWLWATVAAFVPYLIGVIIYLVARSNVKQACVSCGKALQGDFQICPYCGASQEVSCRECNKPVAGDWEVCPHCGHRLGQ